MAPRKKKGQGQNTKETKREYKDSKGIRIHTHRVLEHIHRIYHVVGIFQRRKLRGIHQISNSTTNTSSDCVPRGSVNAVLSAESCLGENHHSID